MNGTLLQDLRFAARSFVHAPRFTVPAVLALALGIGATSAIFSVVRGVMLRPLPYRDPERIVSIWETNISRNQPRGIVAAANFVAWRERQRSFEYLGMVGPARLNFCSTVSRTRWPGCRPRPRCSPRSVSNRRSGRAFTAQEDLRDNDAVIILSHEFWQSRLGGPQRCARHDNQRQWPAANGRRRDAAGVHDRGAEG